MLRSFRVPVVCTSLLFAACVADGRSVASRTSLAVSSAQPIAGASSGQSGTPDVRAVLQEDRKVVGGRKILDITPVPTVEGGALSAQVTDTRSTLQLHFTQPAGDTGNAATRRAFEEAEKSLDVLSQVAAWLKSNPGNNPLESVPADLKVPLARVHAADSKAVANDIRKAIALARSVDSNPGYSFIVEAFRVSGTATTALSLPGYNKVASGQNENETKKEGADPATVKAAKDLIAKAEGAVQAIEEIARRFPSTSNSTELAEMAVYASQMKTALTSSDPASDPIPHGFKNLPPTDIDLPANQVKRGDEIKISVSSIEGSGQGQVGADAERTLRESFIVHVDRIGWYRDDSVAAIIARADSAGGSSASSDDANDWKLSLAATFNWSYYDDPRDHHNCDFYDWLQPGFGVHLAALDQTDDELEFGLGVQVSLWEGLLMFGTGANLSTSENRTYWLIGGDILGWKDKIFGKSGG